MTDTAISTHSEDTYSDGPLSGALDRIHMDTAQILCMLATLQLHEGNSCPETNSQTNPSQAVLHSNLEEDSHNLDHTYYNSDLNHVVAANNLQDHCYSADSAKKLTQKTNIDVQQAEMLTEKHSSTLIEDISDLDTETCVIDPYGSDLCVQVTYLPHHKNISSEEDTSTEDHSNAGNKNQISVLGTNSMIVDEITPPCNSANVSIASVLPNTMEYTDKKPDVLGRNDQANSDQSSISDQNFTYDDNTNTSMDTIAFECFNDQY